MAAAFDKFLGQVRDNKTSADAIADALEAAPAGDLARIQSSVSGYVLATDMGVRNDGTPTQAAMDALMASPAKVIRFTPGVYTATLANGVSDRTFIFDEGAVIDGTVHFATGFGPDATGGTPATPITVVENVRAIGTLTTSVRFGTYYCRNVHVDKVRITEFDPVKYPGQAAAGGSFGIHLYCGTQNLHIGEAIVDSATAGTYALGIDIGATDNAAHWPTNITIDRLIVKGSTQSGINTVKTVNLHIGDADIQSMGSFNGATFTNDTDLRVDRLRINGVGAAAAKDGLHVVSPVNRASFGRVHVFGTTQIGVRTTGAVPIDFEHILSHGNGLDQVRLQAPGRIGQIEGYGGTTGYGVNITTGAAGLSVGRVEAYSNSGTNLFVDADDVGIDIIKTYGTPAGNGTFINGAQRFRNRHIETYGNSQGLRVIGAGVMMGIIRARDNAYGIVGSGLTQWVVDEFIFSGNAAYDSNIPNSSQPGYRAKIKNGVAYPGDANITPTHGTTGDVILYGVPLTANRTVTLSTSGAVSGETRYRITRDGGATGASTLTVLYKALAVGQWVDVAFFSGTWRITGFGSI